MPGRSNSAGNDWQWCIIALDFIENQSLDANVKNQEKSLSPTLNPQDCRRNMYRLKIITVGKIKKNYYLDAIAHYSKMLKPVLRIDVHNVKDCPQAEGTERKRQESERILEKIGPRDTLVAMHEGDRLVHLHGFRRLSCAPCLKSFPAGECCFVIGGRHYWGCPGISPGPGPTPHPAQPEPPDHASRTGPGQGARH
jgi:hypothetical protein